MYVCECMIQYPMQYIYPIKDLCLTKMCRTASIDECYLLNINHFATGSTSVCG